MGKYAEEARIARKLADKKLGDLPKEIQITKDQLSALCVDETEKKDIENLIKKVNIAQTKEEKKQVIIENGAKLGKILDKVLEIVL